MTAPRTSLPVGSTCPICRGAQTVWKEGKPIKCTWCMGSGMMKATVPKQF